MLTEGQIEDLNTRLELLAGRIEASEAKLVELTLRAVELKKQRDRLLCVVYELATDVKDGNYTHAHDLALVTLERLKKEFA